MSLKHYEKLPIVLDSLSLYFNSFSKASYYGSGSTWYDLGGYRKNATLYGDTGFVNDNGGTITFNGTDGYAQCPTPSMSIKNITMTGFVNVTISTKGAFFKNGGGVNGYAIGIGDIDYDSNGNNLIMLFPGNRWIPTTIPLNSGWQMITMTLDEFSTPTAFINTTEVFQSTGLLPKSPETSLYLGRNFGDEPNGIRAATCGIGTFMFYDKVLSLSEISQNFNAFKGRYGI